MHGRQETSMIPRVVCTLAHAILLGAAAWIYFAGGGAILFDWLGLKSTPAGHMPRHIVLFSFGVILFLRICLGHFYLLKRKFGWDELAGVLFALITYQIGFALLGVSAGEELGLSDALAVIVYLIGSWLNTASELQRKKFKDDPANEGKLYTQGMFRYARHINYFGDILWVAAWAAITRNPWATVIPVLLTAGFVFSFIPSLTKHLRKHYGEQYEEWAGRTKALIPFVY